MKHCIYCLLATYLLKVTLGAILPKHETYCSICTGIITHKALYRKYYTKYAVEPKSAATMMLFFFYKDQTNFLSFQCSAIISLKIKKHFEIFSLEAHQVLSN